MRALSKLLVPLLLVGCGGEGAKATTGGAAGTDVGGSGNAGGNATGGATAGSGMAGTSGSGAGDAGASPSGGSTSGGALGVAVFGIASCAIDAQGALSCWGEKTGPDNMWHLPEGPFVELVGGSDHVCAIRADRSFDCFYDPIVGLNNGVTFAPDVKAKAVATTKFFICALAMDGTPSCGQMASNSEEDVTPPPGLKLKGISVSMGYACGINDGDGSITCWGKHPSLDAFCPAVTSAGLTQPPTGSFTAIAGGFWSTCAIDTVGKIQCWGTGKAGDDIATTCSNGDKVNFGQSAPPDGTFVKLSVSSNHACAIRTDGTLACWGAGTADACDTSTNDVQCRQSLPPPGKFRQVAAGNNHTCGLDEAGKVHCWGFDGEGDYTGRTQVPAEFR